MKIRRAPSLPAREAWRYFYDLMFSDESHERMHEVCDSMGFTPGLMKALLFIEPGEPRPMKGLAAAWRCDASYVTSLIDGLEERGIVERRSHPRDRRAKTVALTPYGEQMKTKLFALLHEPPSFMNSLTIAEQRTLRDLLRKIVAASRTGAHQLEGGASSQGGDQRLGWPGSA